MYDKDLSVLWNLKKYQIGKGKKLWRKETCNVEMFIALWQIEEV